MRGAVAKGIGLLRGILRLDGASDDRKFSSAAYWESRYSKGGNSGAGSYNRLAEYKADFVNRFVYEKRIETILELGCGDGSQLTHAAYPKYLGVDVSPTVIESARRKFRFDASKRFALYSDLDDEKSELTISLDVIYHLVEDHVFIDYMQNLFGRAEKYVIIYSSDFDDASFGSHVRMREFSKWVKDNRKDFRLVFTESNRYPFDPEDPDNTSLADFFVYKRI